MTNITQFKRKSETLADMISKEASEPGPVGRGELSIAAEFFELLSPGPGPDLSRAGLQAFAEKIRLKAYQEDYLRLYIAGLFAWRKDAIKWPRLFVKESGYKPIWRSVSKPTIKRLIAGNKLSSDDRYALVKGYAETCGLVEAAKASGEYIYQHELARLKAGGKGRQFLFSNYAVNDEEVILNPGGGIRLVGRMLEGWIEASHAFKLGAVVPQYDELEGLVAFVSDLNSSLRLASMAQEQYVVRQPPGLAPGLTHAVVLKIASWQRLDTTDLKVVHTAIKNCTDEIAALRAE